MNKPALSKSELTELPDALSERLRRQKTGHDRCSAKG